MRNHNDDTIKTSDTVLKKNIPLTLFERVVCERKLETEQNCNILTPTLLAITAFLSRSPRLLSRGPASPNPASSHQLVRSTNSQSGVPSPLLPGVGFLYRILSPTGLVSQLTDFLSSPSYIIVQRPPSCGRHNRTHSTHPRSRLYSDIHWADAPVVYIGAFPILTARPNWIYSSQHKDQNDVKKKSICEIPFYFKAS